MTRRVFTVSQVNRYIRRIFEDDALLGALWIEGELSNVKAHTSGHWYFTLKDENAAIACVMFKSSAERLAFMPKNGMKIIISGHISLYEKTGQYQLYAERMEPVGVGGLQAAFAQLCEKLRAEGLFDAERKRAIPAYVSCVAVVTSPTGAAVQDVIRVVRSRNPAVKIVVAPALVQGQDAAEDIARALAEVNEWGGAEVIILGRGGGSAEDLWAFNEEITARAVAASRIPVISAVGHETDFTVTDFVADFRAPTPTAAAAMVFARDETLAQIQDQTERLTRYMYHLCEQNKNEIKQLMLKSLTRLTQNRLARKRESLATLAALLEKVSPQALWRRGYTAVRDEHNRPVTSVGALGKDDTLTLHFADGHAETRVISITKQ